MISLLAALGACTESAAVRDTPAPAAAAAPKAAEAVDQHEYFDKAVRAMEKMGRVEKADFEQGLIQGVTHSGVAMEIEVVFHEGRTPELNVQAELPPGMAGLGTISEPDRYMAIFRELGTRR
jgi:hypothetical protein